MIRPLTLETRGFRCLHCDTSRARGDIVIYSQNTFAILPSLCRLTRRKSSPYMGAPKEEHSHAESNNMVASIPLTVRSLEVSRPLSENVNRMDRPSPWPAVKPMRMPLLIRRQSKAVKIEEWCCSFSCDRTIFSFSHRGFTFLPSISHIADNRPQHGQCPSPRGATGHS